MTGDAILIAGGYGVVGSRVARDLAHDFPDRVIVAGRRADRADAAAAQLGHGVRAREFDITSPSSVAAALVDVSTVLSCIDQPNRRLLRAAVERGLAYTDITPHLTALGRGAPFERLDSAARSSGARIVLGTGLVPGISSVMVRALADTLGGADAIETSLLLSARDVTGPASFEYFLRELTMPFTIRVGGADHPARPFSAPRRVDFPAPAGTQRAYLFPFSDQVLYPRTLGADTVRSRLALEPVALSRLLSLLVRSRAVSLLRSDGLRSRLASARPGARAEAEARFALRVDVARDGASLNAALAAPAQAQAAAAGAAAVVRSLLDGEVDEPGAWMPEQVIEPARFFARIARHGLVVELLDPARPKPNRR